MKLRIFLIEDSPVIRENLIEHLEDVMDAEVVGWSATQEDSTTWLHQHAADWDLAVVDLFLSHGNGLGVLRDCPDRSSAQSMVVLSNYATQEMRKRCLIEGADAVFDKSQELDEFLAFAQSCHTSRNLDSRLS